MTSPSPAPAPLPLSHRLWPLPSAIELRQGAFPLQGPIHLDPPPGFASPALGRLRGELERLGIPAGPGDRSIRLVLDGRSGHPREGYGLEIGAERVSLVASKGVGLNHGLRTLRQLLATAERQGPTLVLPALAIRDAPAFERRGVMLDVSRDRVPRMDSLFELVEHLAEWKLNELQLYFEHTFAYRDHERVWGGVDPFTPDEVRSLDRHCTAHGIELVPNQQSFGHLHHWLKHPEYRHLAEVPEGILHPFLGAGETHPEPFSLCPTDPGSLDFLAGLYDELLPCFSSAECNVGLDETIDLGPGRSAETIRRVGAGRVYLRFLLSVHALIAARGKRMQFWADILLHHPELVPEVPKDAVACLWGYEADHPFQKETRVLAEAGLPFTVCPGTSSWQSIGGRMENMRANVDSAAHWGQVRGARGLLVTDWGDRGHLQPPSVSWAGFMTAADQSWNPRGRAEDGGHALEIHLARQVSASAPPFSQVRALLDLARAGGLCAAPVPNASPLSVLLTKFDAPFPPAELRELTRERLEEVSEFLAVTLARLGNPPGAESEPGARLEKEIRWAGELMRFSCALGLARLEAGDGRPIGALASSERGSLAARLEPLVGAHRFTWLLRSRPGGLERSARWLERILEGLAGR